MPLSKTEIARLRSLQEKKHREAAGLFIVEGDKVIGELLAAGLPLVEIYATADWPEPAARDRTRPAITRITAAEMARISHFPTPAGVMAVGKINRPPLARGSLDCGLTLALDGVQDPGNVGTMLRLADWFALERVVLSPDCADLFSQKVINASMGSFARVAVHTAPLADALANVRVPVFGCELVGTDVHTLKPVRDAVIVIGSEGRGLSAVVAARVTQSITIPRYGAKCGSLGGAKCGSLGGDKCESLGGAAESLNAAVAAGIVCDLLRHGSKL